MKTNILIAAMLLFLCANVAKATVLTVSNSPLSAAQYSDVQSAINAASMGDSVYVSGSSITYTGGATINKRITLIGAGYAVTGIQNNVSTVISGYLYLDSLPGGNVVSGTHIIGIDGFVNASDFLNNIHIERCRVNLSQVQGEGWVIENCIIATGAWFTGPTNVGSRIIRNNIITGYLNNSGVTYGAGWIIDHNIIEGQILSLNNATITNNIFFYAHISASPNNSNDNYSNNITVYNSADVLPFGTNTGTGNINNVANTDLFISVITNVKTYPAVLNYDWHLLSTSPGHNAATDGTDIGIYGGSHPMPDLTGVSNIPQVTLMNISNSNLPLNGTLNYEVKGRKHN